MATVVFLRGIGQAESSWSSVIASLPDSLQGVSVSVDLTGDFSLEAAAEAIRLYLDRHGIPRAHVCGLSLGAMVALQFAIDHSHRVERLILSGGQVHPNRALMSIQSAVMRMLPPRFVSAPGLSKADVLATLSVIKDVDLRPSLGKVTAPTLVLCGSRDRANLPAARALAAGIPHAALDVVSGAGHQWNVTHPSEFAARVEAFLAA